MQQEVEEEGERLKEAIRIIKGGRALCLLERAALERAFEKWCCFPPENPDKYELTICMMNSRKLASIRVHHQRLPWWPSG